MIWFIIGASFSVIQWLVKLATGKKYFFWAAQTSYRDPMGYVFCGVCGAVVYGLPLWLFAKLIF
jgi:hypothetical protein